MGRRLYAAALLGGLSGVCVAAAQQPSPPNTQPRPPVFRAGAHYVRVDAYPTGKEGKIVEGLTKDDFEIYEDGKLQAIEGAEFITFDTWTPDGERKDPRTQQDAYDLAADPTWRVFVIVIDRAAYGMKGQYYMRGPLHEFIDRNLGPRDLFGLLTTENSPADLVLGQQTIVANAVLDRPEWRIPQSEFDERFAMYYECGLSSLIGRRRLDDTYSLLEGLVKMLGLIRQEKKGIVFVADGLATPGPAKGGGHTTAPDPPRIGITNGRVGEIARPGDRVGGPSRSSACAAERMRLLDMDFAERFRDLLRDGRQANVAFYPISPAGLQGMPFFERGGINMDAFHAQTMRADSLRSLASETDGIAIVDTNDLAGGMRRIANDIRAYYVLGYYTTNTTWDGKVRSIKVRLKPQRDTIRARRQYRAPTLSEIAALSAAASPRPPDPPSAEENALAALSAARPSAPFRSYAARAGRDLAIVLEIPGGAEGASPWPAGADVQALAETMDGEVIGSAREKLGAGTRGFVIHLPLEARSDASSALIRLRSGGMVLTDRVKVPPASLLIGDPIAYKNGTAAAVLDCTRTDSIRFEWPVLGALDRRDARLLDRKGRPLAISLPLSETMGQAMPALVADLALAPLGRGEYLVEATASRAGTTERKLTALRVQ